jgi:hypothetical protein
MLLPYFMPSTWIEAGSRQPLTFHTKDRSESATLVPLDKIIYERYNVYWKIDEKTSVF